MNHLTIKLRNIGRKLGVNQFLGKLISKKNYEEKFNQAILQGIKEGDIVWDVGANKGIYTKLFSELVKDSGRVHAIEPSPFCAQHLTDTFASYQNVKIIEAALSNLNTEMDFDVSSGADSVTNHLIETPTGDTVKVKVMTGDTLSQDIGIPSVLKIDVEGFELDVLQGMPSLLGSTTLRGIFCEVHFRVLESRGLSTAPLEIQKLLQTAGFKTTWVDASHIVGVRD